MKKVGERHNPAHRDVPPGELVVEGGKVAWDDTTIRVELPVAGLAFTLDEGHPGVAQLSRCTVHERRVFGDRDAHALHVSMRRRGGRVQLIAPVDDDVADTFLAELPEIDGVGARTELDALVRLLHAAQRLGTGLAQVVGAAPAERPKPEPPSRKRRLRIVVMFAVAVLVVFGTVVFVAFGPLGPKAPPASPRDAATKPDAPRPPEPLDQSALESGVTIDGLVVASMLDGDRWYNLARVSTGSYVLNRHDAATGEAHPTKWLRMPGTPRLDGGLRVYGLAGARIWATWRDEPIAIDPADGSVTRLRDLIPALRPLADDDPLQLHAEFDGSILAVAGADAWRFDPNTLAATPTEPPEAQSHACPMSSREDGLLPDGRWIGVATVGGEQTVLMETGEPPERANPLGSGHVLEPPSLRGLGEPGAEVIDLNRGAVALKGATLFRGCTPWVVAHRPVRSARKARAHDADMPHWRVPVAHRGMQDEALISLFDSADRVAWTLSLGVDGVAYVRHALLSHDGSRLFLVRAVNATTTRLMALDTVDGSIRW